MARAARRMDDPPMGSSGSNSHWQINDGHPGSIVPWVDLIAAGVSMHAERKIGWIAVLTSHSNLLKFAASRRIQSINRAWQLASSKRAIRTSTLLSNLEVAAINLTNDRACALPDDLDSLSSNYLSQTEAEDRSSKHRPEAFVLSWQAGGKCDDGISDPPDISLRHFQCLDDLCASIFGPIRYYYWTGWFNNASTFEDGLAKQHASQRSEMYIQPPPSANLPSSLKAQIARDRLTAFGWGGPSLSHVLYQLGYGQSDKKGRNAIKSFYMDVNGIQVFELSGRTFPNEANLDIRDISPSKLHLHFSSNHPLDKCILAIEYTGYGSRKIKADIDPMDKLFLFQLPLGSTGFLSGIFTKVRNKAITYPQPATAVRASSVLDRLVRLYAETPDDEILKKSLKEQIKSLVCLSIDAPKIRTGEFDTPENLNFFNISLQLERLLSENMGRGVNRFTRDSELTKSNKQNIISLVHDLAVSGDATFHEAIMAALKTLGEILCLDDDVAESLSTVVRAHKPKLAAKKAFKSIDRLIRENQELFSHLNLSSKSRLRPLTLMRYIARFMHSIMEQDIKAHEKLHDWVAENFRFIWLIPQDPSSSMRESLAIPRGGKHGEESERDKKFVFNISDQTFWENHFRSSIFHLLFSTCAMEKSIELDMKPILEFAMNSLLARDAAGNPGWLYNKIFETSCLIDELDTRIGYCGDFEPAGLLNIAGLESPHFLFLEVLSSSTIMRCVVAQDDGEKFLTDWVQALMLRHLTFLLEQRQGNHATADNRTQPNLLFFQDTFGIVAAALDCCRNKFTHVADFEDHNFLVYFRPETSLKYFRAHHDDPPSFSTSDHRDHKKVQGSPGTTEHNIYLRLVNCFKSTPFSLIEAVGLLELWCESEGRGPDEEIEDLLNDMEQDIAIYFDSKEEFATRRQALMTEYHKILS